MRLDKLPYRDKPMELRGLPTLYGGEGYWLTALPMPLTSTLQHSPGALAHPGRGYRDFAEPGEVPVSFENDDGAGDLPGSPMIAAAAWLIGNDAVVERAIVTALLSSLGKLAALQDGIHGLTDERVDRTWDEAQVRQRCRLLHIVLQDVVGEPPYFGVEFACTWDTEHGYGLMFHGTQVVEWGGGDVPNSMWIAPRHAEGRSRDQTSG